MAALSCKVRSLVGVGGLASGSACPTNTFPVPWKEQEMSSERQPGHLHWGREAPNCTAVSALVSPPPPPPSSAPPPGALAAGLTSSLPFLRTYSSLPLPSSPTRAQLWLVPVFTTARVPPSRGGVRGTWGLVSATRCLMTAPPWPMPPGPPGFQNLRPPGPFLRPGGPHPCLCLEAEGPGRPQPCFLSL